MCKKIFIITLSILMLCGCKQKASDNQIDTPTATPTIESYVAKTPENTESSNTEIDTESVKTAAPKLTPPVVSSAKKDPKRTASIPETPPPNKIISKPVSRDKTVGSGYRSEEVPAHSVNATSAENASTIVKQYLKSKNIYIPTYVELDREDNNFYYIHAYEKLSLNGVEQVSSVGWYNVSKKDSSVTVGEEPIIVGQRPE